jgi:hypothetical protein
MKKFKIKITSNTNDLQCLWYKELAGEELIVTTSDSPEHWIFSENKTIYRKHAVVLGEVINEIFIYDAPKPKFKVGDYVKVIKHISNSLIDMVGTIRAIELNGKYEYLLDFKKIQHWRDFTWVKEDELEVYYSKPLVNLAPSGVNYWFEKFKENYKKLPEFLKGENNMENLKELERKHKEMGDLIAKIKEQEKSKDDYVLRLEYSDACGLLIGFYYDKQWHGFGVISNSGKCYILNNTCSIEHYELWREKGMKVCSDKVEWRGNNYYISSYYTLICWNYSDTAIYNFSSCEYYIDCSDDNIVRFKHNNRPIGF